MNQSSIRAELIVRSLRKKYTVLAFGWNRCERVSNKTNFIHVLRLGAPYGINIRFLVLLPIFWAWIFLNLCIRTPKVIHACNFDTVIPCYAYKLLFRSKLIFDMHDRYAMAFIPWNKGILTRKLHSTVNYLEERIANKVDVLMSVYDKMFLTLKQRPKNCITIMACPADHMTNRTDGATNIFKLLFTGHVRAGRGLEKLLEIVDDIEGTELYVLGRIEDKKLLNKINEKSNSKYIGFLNHAQLLQLELNADAVAALYDSNFQNQHDYGMANKILEAMMCGLPVITNIAREIMRETNCGLVVRYESIKEIRQAIILLRDNSELRTRLGNNGRRAFLEKYNWNSMEKELFKIYDSLLRNT